MSTRAANAYRRVYLESAPPSRILDELYSRLLADIDEARDQITAGDVGAKGRSIGHALAIVQELRAALDFEAAPELAANLASLYGFIVERLLHASTKLDAGALAQARRVIAPLRDAFRDIQAAVQP